MRRLTTLTALAFIWYSPPQARSSDTIRIATFNTSFNRPRAGQLVDDLRTGDNRQARQVAEVIQRVRPDIVLLNEFDYDDDAVGASLFQDRYLRQSQNDQPPIDYPFRYLAPVNTGVPSEHDLNMDGKVDGPTDAFGFGRFPGQYGMLVLSRFPIETSRARTLRRFAWHKMPAAARPVDPETGKPFHSDDVWTSMRLSSKSHWDVPIRVGDDVIHLLACHPTPPAFDGPEDRNGCRNHDEIRLFADYIDPDRSHYIVDDCGRSGGLKGGAKFVIAGDMNADPNDGGSRDRAINQLLDHRLVDSSITPTSDGGREAVAIQGKANLEHDGDPAHDTGDFNDRSLGNLRVDYVLPSRTLSTTAAGVFWPAANESGADLVRASDHRLVWIDVRR